MFSFLKIKTVATPDLKQIHGFILYEENTYAIDVDAGSITNGEKTFSVARSDFVMTETNLFMRRELYGKIFGLDCAFNFRNLEVILTTDLQLPVIRELIRERERKNLSKLDELTEAAEHRVPRRYHWIDGGMLDWSVQNIHDSKRAVQSYSLFAGMEIFGGDLEGYASGTSESHIAWEQSNARWHGVFEAAPYFRQATIGSVGTLSIPGRYGSIYGAQITNSPPTFRRAYGTYLLQDFTEPDWIVELYINQQLIDFVKADAAGMYQFSIPLSYGPTHITLKFYGPWGEERSKEKLIEIPYTLLPAGEVEYAISSGVIENDWKNISRADLLVGLSNRITVGVGAQYVALFTHSPLLPYATAVYRITDELVLNGEYQYKNVARALASYTLPSQLSFEAGYMKYARDSELQLSGIREERRFSAIVPIRSAISNGVARLEMKQELFDRSKNYAAALTFSAAIANVQFNLAANALWTTSEASSSRDARASLSLSFKTLWDISVRPQGEFDVSRGRLTIARAAIERNILDLGWITASYEWNEIDRTSAVQLELRYDLPFTQLNSTVRSGERRSYYTQSARGTIGLDRPMGTVLFNNRNWVRRGAITIRPFLDLNSNGTMDDGEEPVKNLDVLINGGRVVTDDDKTVIRVTDLQPYTEYVLAFSALKLENILWKPRYATASVTVDPDQFKEIDVPIIVTGDVTGTVHRETTSGQMPASGARIVFTPTDGRERLRTLTTSEGEYYMSGLAPGEYSVAIETEQLSVLSLASEPPSRSVAIRGSVEGDYIEGIDFVLSPAVPPIAVLETDTLRKTPVDTTKVAVIPERDTAQVAVAVRPDTTSTRQTVEIVPVPLNQTRRMPINLTRRTLDSNTTAYLDRVIATWKQNRSHQIVIEGHSDNFGTLQETQDRSMQRAQRVRDYLLRAGVPASSLQSRGYGSRRPIASNATAEGRRQNNRVDITITPPR